MNLIEQVIHLRNDKKYYRIRTDYGDNFQTFYDNGFVAIGYNYLGNQRLLENDQLITRQLIAVNENLSEDSTSDKKKISRIYNMVQDFKDLRLGDVVIIPSQDSNRIAFGEIVDNEIFQTTEGTNNCNYIKRRRVRWFKLVHWTELDPKMAALKARGDVINDVSELSEEIDIVMRNLFVKNNLSHFVIDIQTEDPISLVNLIDLLEGIRNLSNLIIERYNLEENIEDITIKLNLQSPGKTELIKLGIALLVIAAMITVSSCGENESGLELAQVNETLELNNEFRNELDSIIHSYNTLNVPINNRQYYIQ
jgi:hypothetical protein